VAHLILGGTQPARILLLWPRKLTPLLPHLPVRGPGGGACDALPHAERIGRWIGASLERSTGVRARSYV